MRTHNNKEENYYSALLLLILTGVLLTSGCAKHPWGKELMESEADELQSILHTMVERDKNCPQEWDSDLKVSYTTPLESKSFNGYLQVLQPSSLKFITYNPLGQPILAISSNGKNFQILNTMETQFTHGSSNSFALHNGIPVQFISGKWGDWITARLSTTNVKDPVFLHDKAGRGTWLWSRTKSKINSYAYYLIDIENMRVTEQRIFSAEDKFLATFNYLDYVENGTCVQPTKVNIIDLPFGAEIEVTVSNLGTRKISKGDFTLPVPKNYYIKLLP